VALQDAALDAKRTGGWEVSLVPTLAELGRVS